jgi:hypothetical protein
MVSLHVSDLVNLAFDQVRSCQLIWSDAHYPGLILEINFGERISPKSSKLATLYYHHMNISRVFVY